MADFVERIVLDDSQFSKALENIVRGITTTEKEFQKTMNSINSEYAKQVKEIGNSSSKMEKMVADGFSRIGKEQQAASSVVSDFGRNVEAASQKVEQYRNQLQDSGSVEYKRVIEEISEITKQIGVEQDNATTKFRNTSAEIQEQTQKLLDLRNEAQQLQEQMSNVPGKLDVQGFKELQELEARLQQVRAESSETSREIQKLRIERGQAQQTIKNLQDSTKEIEKFKKEIKETEKVSSSFFKSLSNLLGIDPIINKLSTSLVGLKDVYSGIVGAGVEFGSLTESQKKSVDSLTTSIGGGRGAILALAKGFNILKIAIAATGIGLLIVALGSLIAFFTRTQEGVNSLQRVFAVVGVVVGKLVDAFSSLGGRIVESFRQGTVIKDFVNLLRDQVVNRVTAIADLFGALGRTIKAAFTLDLDGIKSGFKEAGLAAAQFATGIESGKIAEFGNEVAEATKKTVDLKRQLQDLVKVNRDIEVATAESRAEIRELNKIARDNTKTFSEREQAIRRAISIEQELNNRRIRAAEKGLDIVRQQNELTKNLDKDFQKEADAAIKVANLRAESLQLQTRLQTTLNGITAEQNKLLEDSQNKLRDITKELVSLGRELNIVSEQEEIEFVQQEQLRALRSTREELLKIAEITGADVAPELERLEEIIAAIETGSRKIQPVKLLDEAQAEEINRIETKLIGLDGRIIRAKIEGQVELQTSLTSERDALRKSAEDIKKGIQVEFQGQDIELDPRLRMKGQIVSEPLLKQIEELGNKIKEKLQSVGPALVDSFALIQNVLLDSIRTAIDAQQQLLNEKTDQRRALEDELKKEQELYELGLANNFETKKAEVEGLISEEKKYQEEINRLKEEEAKKTKRLESIAQAEAFITAAVNLFKGFSTIPIVGQALGIAAVASFTGWFAKIKADARKSTRLYTGAERIGDYFGMADRRGATDIPGRGEGYSVVNRRTGRNTGVVISGREMLLPEHISMANYDFFKNMKTGMYDGIDLVEAVDFYRNFDTDNNNTVINSTIIKKEKQRMWVPFERKGKKGAILKDMPENLADGSILYFD